MLVTWMIYGLTLSALIAGGALLIESTVGLYGAQTRRVWVVAMLAAVLVPLVAFVLGGSTGEAAGEMVAPVTRFPGAWFYLAIGPVSGRVDEVLGLIWTVLSVGVGSGFLIAALRVRLASRRWTTRELDGVTVLVSEDVGPAVVGVFGNRIVMPRWALESDATARSLMLRHEQEHVAARDRQVVLFGSVLLVLLAWNPVVWWMAKRLRLAVEVDCDRRVLESARCDVGTYGSLLVDVGRRRAGPVYAGAGFSWARSLLEHRILRMTAPAMGRRNLRAGGLLVGSALVMLAAGYLPTPPSMQSWASGSWLCEATSHARADEGGAIPWKWRS